MDDSDFWPANETTAWIPQNSGAANYDGMPTKAEPDVTLADDELLPVRIVAPSPGKVKFVITPSLQLWQLDGGQLKQINSGTPIDYDPNSPLELFVTDASGQASPKGSIIVQWQEPGANELGRENEIYL